MVGGFPLFSFPLFVTRICLSLISFSFRGVGIVDYGVVFDTRLYYFSSYMFHDLDILIFVYSMCYGVYIAAR